MGLRPRWGRCLSGDRTLLQRSEVSLLFLLPQGGEAEAQADGAPAPRRVRSGVLESTQPRTSAFLAPKPALGSALGRQNLPSGSVEKWGRNGHASKDHRVLLGLGEAHVGETGEAGHFCPGVEGVRVALLAPLTCRGRRGEEREGSEKPEWLLLPVAWRGKTACFHSLEGT